MKEHIKRFFHENIQIIVLASLFSLIRVLLITGLLKRPYIFCNDQWFQFNLFYKEWIRLLSSIKELGLPFYSWNLFLGSDFYSSMALYCTGSLFMPLHLLLQNHLSISFVLEIELCALIGAIGFNLFLSAERISDKNLRTALSLIYAFGGVNIIYLGNYMFSRFVAILPFMFLGVTIYFKENKRLIFIISSALLFLQNLYFMFPTLLFLLMYCICKEMVLNKKINGIISDFVNLLLGLIIAFGVGAFINIPGIIALLGNPRLGASDNNLLWQSNVYYGLITSLISLNPVYIIPNIFETAHDAHDNYYNLLIGILPTIFFIRYLTNSKNKKPLVLFLLLSSFVMLPQLSRILHGFSVPSLRPTFLYFFILLFFAAKGGDLSNKNDTIIVVIYYSVVLVCLLLAFIQGYILLPQHSAHLSLLCASLLAGLLIFFVYQKNRRLALILSVLFVWSSGSFYMIYSSKDSVPEQKIIDPEQVAYQQYIDSDKAYRFFFDYRYNIPGVELNLNQQLNYGFMSSSGYISTIDSVTSSFTSLIAEKHGLDWCLEINDPYALTALGTKYYIVANDEELPNELDFKYAYSFDNYLVFENMDFQGFGYTAGRIRPLKEFTDSKSLLTTVYVEDNTDIKFASDPTSDIIDPFVVTERGNNYFHGIIDSNSDNILYVPLPNNKGWKILVDDVETDTFSVNGGFMGIRISKGIHAIDGYFLPVGLKEGLAVSTLAFVGIIWIVIKERHQPV